MSSPKQRRVVCAAVRAADGTLLLGIRHYSPDMHQQIAERRDGAKFTHRLDEDQGFVDQYGQWLSRADAYDVAARAGQILPGRNGVGRRLDIGPVLYSEALY